jgi:hypothetical protein
MSTTNTRREGISKEEFKIVEYIRSRISLALLF